MDEFKLGLLLIFGKPEGTASGSRMMLLAANSVPAPPVENTPAKYEDDAGKTWQLDPEKTHRPPTSVTVIVSPTYWLKLMKVGALLHPVTANAYEAQLSGELWYKNVPC